MSCSRLAHLHGTMMKRKPFPLEFSVAIMKCQAFRLAAGCKLPHLIPSLPLSEKPPLTSAHALEIKPIVRDKPPSEAIPVLPRMGKHQNTIFLVCELHIARHRTKDQGRRLEFAFASDAAANTRLAGPCIRCLIDCQQRPTKISRS